MKIVSIGYYDDFARFFLAIKKELKKRGHVVEFIYIILLKRQAMAYIDLFEKKINMLNPDIIILSGDSRMSVEILKKYAQKLNIKVFYFEQCPFNTTIFDEDGVLANSSIAKRKSFSNDYSHISYNQKYKVINDLIKTKPTHYSGNPFYRMSDYLYQHLFRPFKLLPIDIAMPININTIRQQSNYTKIRFWNRSLSNHEQKIFLLILQVPEDANIVHHSPIYSDHLQLLKDVFINLPQHTNLLVREHPLFKRKYGEDFYTFMLDNSIQFDKGKLEETIEIADIVIVINSSVGMKSIAQLKTTIVLGNAFYAHNSICLKLEKKTQLKQLLKDSLSYQVNKQSVINFLYYSYKHYFIESFFRDENLTCVKNIAQTLINYQKKSV